METRTLIVTTTAAVALLVPRPHAMDLRPEAVVAFDRYVRLTEARMADEIDGRSPFLWIDRQTGPARTAMMARLSKGAVESSRLETLDGGKTGKTIEAPGARLHHWIGTVLLPGVTIDKAMSFVQSYDRYPGIFAPMIQRANVVNRSGDVFEVAMRTRAEKVMTVVLDADYRIEYRRLSPARLYSKSVASRVHEVKDAGRPSERRTPTEDGWGFLYRLNTYCSFEEKPEGTYEQCESVSLTAKAPFLVRAIVNAITNSMPREALEFTLGRVRQHVGK